MTVILPVIVNNRSKIIRPLNSEDGLKTVAENKNTKEAIFLLNKLPIWNENVQVDILTKLLGICVELLWKGNSSLGKEFSTA